MQKDDLLKLADRVEALSGPDRKVDELIERAVGTYSAFRYYTLGDDDQPDYIPTRYTASLDAAETLVPGGENGRWNTGKFNTNAKKCTAQVAVEDEIFIETGSLGRGLKVRSSAIAATPALALCAAALRALAGGE